MQEAEDCYPNMMLMCRLCLKEDAATVDIFSQKGNQPNLAMRIMACAALEVQSNDSLPTAICLECRYQLEKSYYFRKRSHASDAKLRKHLRLLNLGKRSRVFAQTDEEKIEDELEFEDSLRFLKQEDERREQIVQLEQQEFKNEMQMQMHNQLKEAKKNWTNLYRTELLKEVKDECIATAKKELREEVADECRKIEMETLLCELKDFLNKKVDVQINANESVVVPQEKIEEVLEKSPTKTPTHQTKSEKMFVLRKTGKPKQVVTRLMRKVRLQKMQKEQSQCAQDSVDNEASCDITDELPFEILPDETSIALEECNTESNFYILTEKCNEQQPKESTSTTITADDYGSSFGSEVESENFEETADVRTVSYQILGFAESNEEKNNDDNNMTKADKKDTKDENAMVLKNVNESERLEDIELVDANESSIDLSNVHKNTENAIKKILPVENKVENELAPNFAIFQSNNQQFVHRATDTPKTFKCHHCFWLFSTDLQRKIHMRTHTKAEKKGVTYQCTECLIFVSCRSALKRHMVIHTGVRPYQCEECGKSFVQREILKRHTTIHTGERKHKCQYCSSCFTQKVNLTQHINKNHLAVPKLQLHQCHLCVKRFNHASGLSRHLATHSGVAFQCTECDRTFQDRSSVKRHIIQLHGSGNKKKLKTKPNIVEKTKENEEDESSMDLGE